MQVSIWNFVKYNVVGGGDSALYGVEPATSYLKNGALNLNVGLVLFCLFPFFVLLQLRRHSGVSHAPLSAALSCSIPCF